MSRRSVLWLVVLLVFVLAACGGNDKPATYTTLTVQQAYDQLSNSTAR